MNTDDEQKEIESTEAGPLRFKKAEREKTGEKTISMPRTHVRGHKATNERR